MNVEEAVEYLWGLSDDKDATAIDIVLEPSDDGAESEGAEPGKDIVDLNENIILLGPKLLTLQPHIELPNMNSCLLPCLG